MHAEVVAVQALIRRSIAAIASAALHAGAYAVLVPASGALHREFPPALVELVAAPPQPVASEPERDARAEPVPSLREEPSKPAPKAVSAVRPAAVPNPAPEAIQAGPLDLTNLTMTAGDASWSALSGTNTSSASAVTANGARLVPQIPNNAGPRVVPIDVLAKRPVPPNLDAALRQNYPSQARRLGLSGQAVVRGRVAPNGRLERAWVVSETAAGFGKACERTILGTVWSPPLDEEGRPVHTEIKYTCRFRIDD